MLQKSNLGNRMPGKVWFEISHLFPNWNACTDEGSELVSNFVPNFMMDVITYPCWF